MKKQTLYTIWLPGLVAILCFSACKDKKTETPAPAVVAGKGGSSILRVIPRHHSKEIDSCTVYIKYNAQDLPANGKYDDSLKVVKDSSGHPYAIFTGLKKGNYYLYGYGWDKSIADTVLGGSPHIITTDGTEDMYLQITEGD